MVLSIVGRQCARGSQPSSGSSACQQSLVWPWFAPYSGGLMPNPEKRQCGSNLLLWGLLPFQIVQLTFKEPSLSQCDPSLTLVQLVQANLTWALAGQGQTSARSAAQRNRTLWPPAEGALPPRTGSPVCKTAQMLTRVTSCQIKLPIKKLNFTRELFVLAAILWGKSSEA